MVRRNFRHLDIADLIDSSDQIDNSNARPTSGHIWSSAFKPNCLLKDIEI